MQKITALRLHITGHGSWLSDELARDGGRMNSAATLRGAVDRRRFSSLAVPGWRRNHVKNLDAVGDCFARSERDRLRLLQLDVSETRPGPGLRGSRAGLPAARGVRPV
jgi:hypothetical protein